MIVYYHANIYYGRNTVPRYREFVLYSDERGPGEREMLRDISPHLELATVNCMHTDGSRSKSEAYKLKRGDRRKTLF